MNDARDAMRSICSRRARIAERGGIADVVVIPAKAGIHRRAIAPQTRRN
jgi:NAD(P)H-dependent flavin oxidoreductase YrpB (nitropropane dioxygenase family)